MWPRPDYRSEEHTSEFQSLTNLVCRLLLEKKKKLESSADAPGLVSVLHFPAPAYYSHRCSGRRARRVAPLHFPPRPIVVFFFFLKKAPPPRPPPLSLPGPSPL